MPEVGQLHSYKVPCMLVNLAGIYKLLHELSLFQISVKKCSRAVRVHCNRISLFLLLVYSFYSLIKLNVCGKGQIYKIWLFS